MGPVTTKHGSMSARAAEQVVDGVDLQPSSPVVVTLRAASSAASDTLEAHAGACIDARVNHRALLAEPSEHRTQLREVVHPCQGSDAAHVHRVGIDRMHGSLGRRHCELAGLQARVGARVEHRAGKQHLLAQQATEQSHEQHLGGGIA